MKAHSSGLPYRDHTPDGTEQSTPNDPQDTVLLPAALGD